MFRGFKILIMQHIDAWLVTADGIGINFWNTYNFPVQHINVPMDLFTPMKTNPPTSPMTHIVDAYTLML